MKSDPKSDLESRLAELREAYRAGLQAKQTAIATALACVRRDRPGSLDDLELLAHRLRGTAGAYGFPAVGEAAGRLEDQVVELARIDPLRRSSQSWNALEGAVAELATAIAAQVTTAT